MKALRFLTQDMLLAKSFYAALCGLRPAAAFGLLACLLFPGTSHGYDPSVSLSELRHAVWRSEEGAPSNVVALAQTPDGFLWLGTGAGLFRFDGVRFERITTLGSKALLAASITALHTTLSGDLVIGYRFGGVSIMRGTEIEHFSAADGLPRSNAWAFAQGDDGDLWAAFTNGVFRKRAGVWQMFALDGEMLPYRTILRDGEGNIWVSARTGAFVFPKGASAFQRADVALRRFPSLSVAPDGRVWAADFDRLRIGPLVQEGSTFRLAPDQDHVPLPRTGDLHWFDSGGALWIRTGEGLVRIARTSLNQGSDSGEPFGAAKEPNCFLEDREGNIWLGAADGLHRFSQGNVRRVEFGANGGGRVAVAAAGGSDVWATTEFGGLFRIGATVESLGHISRHASHLYRDRDGVIWVGSRDALWRVDDNNTAKEISRPDSGKDEHAPIFAPIHAIARDRSVGRSGCTSYRKGRFASRAIAGVLWTATRGIA
jgi:ligand-binding sensor domain-containing protein